MIVSLQTPTYPNQFDKLRLGLLYFVALSASLGTAVSALGRLALYLAALAYLITRAFGRRPPQGGGHAPVLTWLILVTVAYMALTSLWSSVGSTEGLTVWSRHARILTIPVMVCMIASTAEARLVLRVFLWGQVFVVVSAWLLVVGLPVPWATGAWQGSYAVFSSYLEQCITQAVLVVMLWSQRHHVFGPRGAWVALGLALLTAVLTLGLMPGRSGHVVLLALMALVGAHELPKKYRWAALAIPLMAFLFLLLVSSAFRDRMNLVASEVNAHLRGVAATADSSSGMRLKYWRHSLEAVAEKPLLGHGAGSWNNEYMRLKGAWQPGVLYSVSDPHQIFLLWAVEGGLLGLCLLCAVLLALWRLAQSFASPERLTMQTLMLGMAVAGLFNSVPFGIGLGDFFCIGLGILAAFKRDLSATVAANREGQPA